MLQLVLRRFYVHHNSKTLASLHLLFSLLLEKSFSLWSKHECFLLLQHHSKKKSKALHFLLLIPLCHYYHTGYCTILTFMFYMYLGFFFFKCILLLFICPPSHWLVVPVQLLSVMYIFIPFQISLLSLKMYFVGYFTWEGPMATSSNKHS